MLGELDNLALPLLAEADFPASRLSEPPSRSRAPTMTEISPPYSDVAAPLPIVTSPEMAKICATLGKIEVPIR